MGKLLTVFLLLCLSLVPARADWQVRTGNTPYPTVPTQWSFVAKPNLQLRQARSGNESLPLQSLQLTLRDGKTQQSLALSAPQAKNAPNTLSASQTTGSLRINQKLELHSPQNSALVWTIEFTNGGAEEAWIETGLSGEVNQTTGLRFWDGYELRTVAGQKLERSTPLAAFPASMLQSRDGKSAIVVGLHPDNDISWLTTRLDPAQKEFFTGGRFSIPGGEKVRLAYVLYVLQPRFGEGDAIDGYYQRFPRFFTATPGTDPRLTGFRGVNSSYVPRTIFGMRDTQPEVRILAGLGKMHAGWDWSYNTYKYSGDWYGRAESWELPLSQGDQVALDEYIKTGSSFDLLNLAQFHRDRIALYKNADVRANIHMSFYLLNFVQAELAQRNDWMKYTYGYFRADDHASGRIKHWVVSYDDTWHMFPWATPLEDVHRRDLPAILNELETSSFAIDVYADSAPYRGPTMKYLPGWSYDEKGRFINTGLANKQLVKFIHTLRKGKFAASVVANLSPWETDPALKADANDKTITNYSTVFAPDAYIVEGDVSNLVDYDQPGRLFPKRYLFGKKYISSVSGAYQDRIGERIPWQTMSPNQIRAAYTKYLKKRLMAYYQGGILPNYDDARGISLLANEMPRLLEVQLRGFCAAPASAGNEKLQRRRYGDGLGAALVYSNPTAQAVQSSEVLLNNYFHHSPNALALPFEDKGETLTFSSDRLGAQSRFTLNVASMANRVLLVPMALRMATPQAVTGSTRFEQDIHQQSFSVSLKTTGAVTGGLLLAPPRDFSLGEVSLNGKKLPVGKGEIAIRLNAGENHLRVVFASTQFRDAEAKLTAFNWSNFQLVVAGAPNERKTSAAQILADYATYYHQFTPLIESKSTFDAAAATRPTVVITTDSKWRGVGFDANGILHVTGADDFDTQQLAWRLARVLDARHPQMPAATFTHPSTKAMLTRIGLMTLPETSAVAKPITPESLAAVPGEDTAPAGQVSGNVAELDFGEVRPLPRDNWTATASSIYEIKENPILTSQALDDIAGTRWTPGRGIAGAWFMVDMQEVREFNHVRLKSPYPYKYFPLHYKVEISEDGQNWRETAKGEGAKDTEIYWPQLQKARYIRVSLTEDQPEFWSIDEFLVYKRVLPQVAASIAPPLETLPQLKVPRLDGKIELDGKPDEASWQKATVVKEFSPLKNRPATQATEFRVAHDAEAFYLGFICYEANMDKLWEPATQRDGAVWDGDDLEIYLSPGDGGGQLKFPYYQFLLSPSGVQTDLKVDATGQTDLEWSGDWQVQTFKAADRWSAEVRIPFKTIGLERPTKIWRANIGRIETPNGDITTWAPMKDLFAQPSLFGVWSLEGMGG